MSKLPVGRPPELIPDEALDELGRDLLHWLDNDGKDEVFFHPWFYDIKGMFRGDWKALIKRTGFVPYYEVARKKISNNLMRSKNIPQSYGNRYLGLYDDEVRDDEESVKDKDAERESKNSKNFSTEDLAKLQAFFEPYLELKLPSRHKEAEENHKA